MILFAAIEPDDCLSAYHWHRGFVGANNALFPRQHDDFQSMVMEGNVWAAKSPADDYLALAYATYDEARKICEVGGLMVATQVRGQGLGATIMRLTLAHVLLEENLMAIPSARVIAHVIEGNEDPRGIITEVLKFRHVGAVSYPAAELPGLRATDGFVHGDEYELTSASLEALADWAETWKGQLNGATAHIELRPNVGMEDWGRALRSLASRRAVAF